MTCLMIERGLETYNKSLVTTNVLAKKKNKIFLRRERNTAEVLGKVKYLFLFGGELVKVGVNS